MVQVEFVDGSGTRSSEGVAMVNNLAAGQKANEKARGGARQGARWAEVPYYQGQSALT
ncbi:hypothetical protein ACIQFZ_30015 [Streptomyces sp. NPDC093064]|uniref:hypothetical protein n=1 Tax=Streptomyces sp. NPDC093064 TaxID=3366020 RepID=UPI00381FD287